MNTGSIHQLLLGAIFLSADVTHAIKGLQNRDDLRRLAHIDSIPLTEAVHWSAGSTRRSLVP